jgi:hypothetical protein
MVQVECAHMKQGILIQPALFSIVNNTVKNTSGSSHYRLLSFKLKDNFFLQYETRHLPPLEMSILTCSKRSPSWIQLHFLSMYLKDMQHHDKNQQLPALVFTKGVGIIWTWISSIYLLKAHLQATLNYSECKVTHFVYCGRFRDYYKPHYGINNFNNLSKNICRYCTTFEYLHHVISVISIFMELISDSQIGRAHVW